MSKMRHKKATGGAAENEPEPKPYNAQGSETEKEAEAKSVEAEEKADKKAKGGKVRHKGMEAEGHGKKMHLGRMGRKAGGGVGADMHPLSTAARVKNADGH